MEFSTGSKVTITQIGANDFKGDWNFTSKVFCKDGFATQANKVTLSNGIVIGEPTGGDLFFFNDTATTEIYTLSLHDALPI